ncbi:hypothetical protein HZH68_008778 [Vespula germanica]|uniref:Uncharacterized protein n=1 Tax=Vespula germanica TaxID=30212 RepID=A0A834K1R9_VESGE|nr:hypothetical protein HZH68_008778 [Vespula germanica]
MDREGRNTNYQILGSVERRVGGCVTERETRRLLGESIVLGSCPLGGHALVWCNERACRKHVVDPNGIVSSTSSVSGISNSISNGVGRYYSKRNSVSPDGGTGKI